MALTQEQIAEMRKIQQKTMGSSPAPTAPSTSTRPASSKQEEMLNFLAASESSGTSKKKKKGGVKKFVQGLAKPFLKAGTATVAIPEAVGSLAGAGVAAAAGNKEKAQAGVNRAYNSLTRERDFGYLGKSRPIGVDQETGEKQTAGQLAKDVAGSAAEIGSYVVGGGGVAQVGKASLKGLVKQGVNIGIREGLTTGALQGAGSELQDKDSTAGSVVKSGAIGGAVGAATGGLVGLAAPAIRKVASEAGPAIDKLAGKKSLDEVVGTVAQGETSDIPLVKKALRNIDLKGIGTYKDLTQRVEDTITSLAQKQDEIFTSSPGRIKLDDLTNTIEVGKRSAKENFVSDALNDLEELYSKTKDTASLLKIQNLKDEAAEKGLSKKQINDLARQYGGEFKNKAFGKNGEPLTSVNATRFENTRVGIKETVRNKLGNETTKILDSQMSDLYRVRDLAAEMTEKVNRLQQRVQKRNIFQKLGRGVADAVDVATFGGLKSFVARLLPSNVGLKTLNALDLEAQLGRNLKLIEKMMNMSDDELIEEIGKQSGKGLINLNKK